MTKRFAPATERNREPILDVLRRALPDQGVVLEIASGTGQHVSFFASRLAQLTWQPTDVASDAIESTSAWLSETELRNTRAPISLDVRAVTWPLQHADAVLCINMIHITPWDSTVGLFAGASRILPVGAPLITYGPYRISGEHTALSNAAFDARLRGDNPEWGVRDIDDLIALGDEHGFSLEDVVAMPANNFTLVWKRVDNST